MKLYQTDHRQVRRWRERRTTAQVFYGVAKAEAFVQALYKAGQEPRPAQGLMNALLSMNTNKLVLLPGIVQKTSKTDHFVISQMQLQRFNSSDEALGAVRQADRGSPALRASPCM